MISLPSLLGKSRQMLSGQSCAMWLIGFAACSRPTVELETDERAAVRAVASIDLNLVTRVANHLRGHPGFPAKWPGTALNRLVAALTDDEPDPILSPRRKDGGAARRGAPKLPLNTQLERVEPAVALDLLMAKAPQSPEDAAKGVLDLLRESHAEALVRQWRKLSAGGDFIPR